LDVAHHIAVMSLTDAAGEAPLEAGYSLAAGAAPGGSEPLRPMAAREWSAPAPDPATIVLSSPPNTASVNDVQSLGQVSAGTAPPSAAPHVGAIQPAGSINGGVVAVPAAAFAH